MIKRTYYPSSYHNIWLDELALRLLKDSGIRATKSDIARALLDLAKEHLKKSSPERPKLLAAIETVARSGSLNKVSLVVEPEDDLLIQELRMANLRKGISHKLSDVVEGIFDWAEGYLRDEAHWESFVEHVIEAIPDEDGRGKRNKLVHQPD